MNAQKPLRRWAAPIAASALLVAALAVEGGRPALALINESPSLPRGLYLRTDAKVERNVVVAVSQPMAARPYLARLGMPGDLMLLKRVAAVGGDRVCAEEGAVRTPSRLVQALGRDRRGSILPVWRECRVLARDELFLLGDTPGSFDSRYFGPVQRGEARGVYREVLAW